MESSIDLGLGKVCRACLSDDGEMKSVFESAGDNPEVQIFKIFESITALEITENDGLPVVICLSCELRLNNAYSFRELCQKSKSTLTKYVENALKYTVKQEELPEDRYIIETLDEDSPIKEETSDLEVLDVDDQPLIARQEAKTKSTQFSADVVNEAILESRKKFYQSRECRICGFQSSNARGLSLHIAHLHKDLKNKWCTVCYEEVDELEAHMQQHGKGYRCRFCGKAFSSQGHLTEHIRSHSLERPHKCKLCGKGFLSARHLRVHDRVHSGLKPFLCPYCGRRFTQNGSLQGHIRTHTGLKPFQCEVCKKRTTTSSALAIHRHKTGHRGYTKLLEPQDNGDVEPQDNGDVEPQLKLQEPQAETVIPATNDPIDKDALKKLCTVCGKTFSTASKLRLHMRVHTGETPYKCEYCVKRFSTRGQLVVHTRTHTGEKPHVCDKCGKGFAQSSVLNTHMKLHTGRPEQCQVCDQRFCRPAELRLHMRKHTGEKPYLCTECGTAFIQRSHLMEHIKIHSDERPYKCHLCERAFKQSSSLKSHVQIHTGYKPYKCAHCPYACRQPYSLGQHMKQHGGEGPQAQRPFQCLVCKRSFTTQAMLSAHSRTVHQAIF